MELDKPPMELQELREGLKQQGYIGDDCLMENTGNIALKPFTVPILSNWESSQPGY